MKQMLKTYLEALELTELQLEELQEQLKKAKSAEKIMLVQRKIAIAESQRCDIVNNIHKIKEYIEIQERKK